MSSSPRRICKLLAPASQALAAACSSPATLKGSMTRADVAVEVYPAGLISTVGVRHRLDERDEISFRVGHNETDRQDFGEHDDETGSGPGFGLGYRSYFHEGREGAFWGGRIDTWWLEIDWEEDGEEGTTDVVVLQPTAELGYAWPLAEGLYFTTHLALGAEINVDTDGEDVGEGAIGLLGVALTYGF